jgi:hypothetical protein
MVTKAQPSYQAASLTSTESTGARNYQAALEDQNTQGVNWNRGTGSESRDRYAGSVLGAVAANAAGSDIYEAVSKGIDDISSSTDAGVDIYTTVSQQTEESVRRNLDSLSGAANGDVATMTGVYDELKKWRLDKDKPWGFEAFTVQQLDGLAQLYAKDTPIAKERLYQRYGGSMIADEYDKHGKLDTIWDFAKLFVMPGTTLAMGNFTEQFDPKLVGTAVNTLDEVVGRIPNLSIDGKGFEAYKATLDQFWKLPVDKRLVTLPMLDKHIKDIAGSNTFVYMNMMTPFVEKEAYDTVNMDYLVDTATFLGLIPGKPIYKMMTFANKARMARRPIQILKETGNATKAADLINAALADRDANRARKVTGMDRSDLAASVQPFDLTTTVANQVTGVAQDAITRLGDDILKAQGRVDQEFDRALDPSQTPRRIMFDETAKLAHQQEMLNQYAYRSPYPAYAKIVNRTDDGFEVEVEYGSKSSGVYDKEHLEQANKMHEQSIADLHERAAQIREQIPGGIARSDAQSLNVANMDRYREAGLPVKDRTKKKVDTRTLEERADEEFGVDDEVVSIQNQLRAVKEQIKKNNKIIADLDKPLVTQRHPVKYTFKQTGIVDAEELQRGTFPKIASPSQVADQIIRGQVDNATLAEFTEAKLNSSFLHAQRDLVKGTGHAEREAVDKLLLHGDEMGRETFRVDELIDGVDTKWGKVKLDSAKSIALYYGQRRMYQRLHEMKNYLKTRELEVAGYRQLSAKVKKADGMPVKLYAKETMVDELGNPVSNKRVPSGVQRIYDHQTGKVVDVTDEIHKRLGGDWQVVQFRHGYRFEDEVVNFGVIKPNSHLKPITGQVLDYHPGYVTKQRPGVFYTATRESRMLVDGVSKPRYSTVRFFRTEQEGHAWKAGLSADDQQLTTILPDKRYKHSEYMEHDEEFDALNFGGIYTGERTDRSILMGLDGEDAHRVSSYKALSLYMGHVANRYSTNELKMNIIGKFQNSYGKYLTNPSNWKSDLKNEFFNDLSLKRSIEAQRDYIKDIIRLPDPMQDWWNQKMRNLAEVMEGSRLGGKPRDWVMQAGLRDPTAALRTATFHLYLGMYNMSQFLVQGLGMTVAASAYPTKAAKLIPKNFALRAMWHERGNPGAVSKILEGIGVDADELTEIAKEIDRIGLFDSLKTSADYNAGINGISATGDAVRRVFDGALMPMREGEQFARGYGYLLARDLFLKGKKNHKLTEKEIDQVARDSLKFTLNLNRSNRAFWQNGVLSIPTQFLQVTTKFYENMIAGSFDRSIRSKVFGGSTTKGYGNRVWTAGEKAKIMLGHLAMFGMAGVPFMDSAVSNFTELYRSATNDPREMTTDRLNIFNGTAGVDDATFARAARGGLVQVMAHFITGADPELTSRLSIPAGIEDTVEMYQHGDKDMLAALGGAMAPGMGRVFDSIVGLGRIFNSSFSEGMSDEELKQVMRELSGVFSSTRNLDKAYWFHKLGGMRNNKGQLIVELGDEELNSTLLWQAAGFSSAKVGYMFDLQHGAAELKRRKTEATALINDTMDRYFAAPNLLQSESNQRHLNKIVETVLSDLTEAERVDVLKGVKTHLADDDQKLLKAVTDSVKATAEAGGRGTAGSLLNPLLVSPEVK